MVFSTVTRSALRESTPDRYVIDVLVYDSMLPVTLKTRHHDKSFNYVAYVAFAEHYNNISVNWNLDPVIMDDHNYNAMCDYMETNEAYILEMAIEAFKSAYPNYSPNKVWG